MRISDFRQEMAVNKTRIYCSRAAQGWFVCYVMLWPGWIFELQSKYVRDPGLDWALRFTEDRNNKRANFTHSKMARISTQLNDIRHLFHQQVSIFCNLKICDSHTLHKIIFLLCVFVLLVLLVELSKHSESRYKMT